VSVVVVATIAEEDGARVLRRGNTTLAMTPDLPPDLAKYAVGTNLEVTCEIEGATLIAFEVGGEAKTIAPPPVVATDDDDDDEEDVPARADRADLDDIERMFGVHIPTALRAAWQRAFVEPTLFRFIGGDRKTFSEAVEFIMHDHHESLASRLILPFAEDDESDYYVLDLSRPSNGDFPVMLARHDDQDSPHEIATSSAEWLARGPVRWGDENE
jgi:hypothetical protein